YPRTESPWHPLPIPSRLRGRDERSAEGAGGHGVVRGGSRRGQPAALGRHGPWRQAPPPRLRPLPHVGFNSSPAREAGRCAALFFRKRSFVFGTPSRLPPHTNGGTDCSKPGSSGLSGILARPNAG